MSRENILILLGVLVLLTPFIGVPVSILSWILPLLALGIIGIAYTLRVAKKSYEKPK
jgi:hypothetical protein